MAKRIVDGIEVEAGSGNVFADLGLPDARKLKIKSGLVVEISKAVRKLGLSQVEAASRLVPDDVVQRCTASGSPAEVVVKVDEYVANGCTCPILYPLGPDVGLMLDTFRRDA